MSHRGWRSACRAVDYSPPRATGRDSPRPVGRTASARWAPPAAQVAPDRARDSRCSLPAFGAEIDVVDAHDMGPALPSGHGDPPAVIARRRIEGAGPEGVGGYS